MRSRPSPASGALRLDVLVAVVLISVWACLLLDSLNDLQRASERTVVDMEVASLRAELQMTIASRVVRGEEAQLAGWAGSNPAQRASRENFDTPAGFGLTGAWRWDGKTGTLNYTYRGGECLQLRLSSTRPGLADGWSLGAGLLLVPLRKENPC